MLYLLVMRSTGYVLGARALRRGALAHCTVSRSRHLAPPTACSSSQDLPYAELAQVLQDVELEPLRLRKEALMAEMLRRAWTSSRQQLWLCISLASLQLRPAEPPLKLGMGNKLILSALAEACGTPADELKDHLTQLVACNGRAVQE